MQFNRYFSYFCGVLLKKKKIDRTIDMRNIPTITKNLLIINVIAFLAYYVLSLQHIDLNNLLGLHFFLASDFHLYQLVTYMFMHANLQHIFFNMFALWMFGCVIENVWGPKKFLFYYISCGVGAGLIQELTQLGSLYVLMNQSGYDISLMQLFSLSAADAQALNAWTTVGASGAIYAILLAFGMLFPEERLFIFPLPVPIKAKWLITAYIVIELFAAMSTTGDNVAHFAHLGGMLFGFLMIRYWRKKEGYSGFGTGNSPVDKFKKYWEKHSKKSVDDYEKTRKETDWEYNARKKEEQDEVDRILDKIRKSGYDSLTKEEKRRLFDNNNRPN